MSKHTPGPWRVEYGEPLCPDLETLDGSRVRGIRLWEDDACDDPESRANHRLIAAAPELLEALEAVMGTSPSFCLGDPCGTCDECRAKAAIRKARGE